MTTRTKEQQALFERGLRKCSLCKKVKPLTEFYFKKYYESRCRECDRKRAKIVGKDRFRKQKEKLIMLKGGKCEICSYNKCIAALEFHHLNPEEKENDWDFRRKDFDLSKVRLLCANCHREQHNI